MQLTIRRNGDHELAMHTHDSGASNIGQGLQSLLEDALKSLGAAGVKAAIALV